MGHSVKAVTLTSALVWCACMLFAGFVNLAFPSYGSEFLRMMNSIYPGADSVRTIGRVLLGGLYGFVDGAIVGCVFAFLYQVLAGHGHKEAHQ
jgi:hypothetical protein